MDNLKKNQVSEEVFLFFFFFLKVNQNSFFFFFFFSSSLSSKSGKKATKVFESLPGQVLHLQSAIQYLRAENSRLKSQIMGISLSSLDFENETSQTSTKELTDDLKQANNLVKGISFFFFKKKILFLILIPFRNSKFGSPSQSH